LQIEAAPAKLSANASTLFATSLVGDSRYRPCPKVVLSATGIVSFSGWSATLP
jgi:hypothetical protein